MNEPLEEIMRKRFEEHSAVASQLLEPSYATICNCTVKIRTNFADHAVTVFA